MKTLVCLVCLMITAACGDSPTELATGGSVQRSRLNGGTPINTIYGKYYKFDVMAKSGWDLIMPPTDNSTEVLGESPSINDQGRVAFVGKVLGAGDHVFIDDGSNSLSLGSTQLSLSPVARINTQGHVAVTFTGSLETPPQALIWTGLDTSTTVFTRDGDYTDIRPLTALNDNDETALPAIRGSPPSGPVVITTNWSSPAVPGYYTTPTYTLPSEPSLSRDGHVLLTRHFEFRGPTQHLLLFSHDLSSKELIADADCFTSIGSSAISPDGRIIVFYGTPRASCAISSMQDSNTSGGIFASLDTGGPTRTLIQISGVKIESPSSFTGNRDGTCDPGEVCESGELGFDQEGNPLHFNSYTNGARIALAHEESGAVGLADDSFVVSFVGTPNQPHPQQIFSGQQGIWTVRVDLSMQGSTLKFKLFPPMPVVQIGDLLGNGETISSLSPLARPQPDIATARTTYDGITRNQRPGDHRLVFYAQTTSGHSLIVRGEHLDSDEDGLADHWERNGIDFDQDGTVDLNLPLLYGTNALRKDLLVEIDYMEKHGDGSVAGHSHNPGPERFDWVKQAFDQHNIRLQQFVDESIDEVATGGTVIGLYPKAPKRTDITLPSTLKYFSDFKYGSPSNPCETAWLGTAAERGSGNCLNILHARNIATRYVLFGHRNANQAGNPGISEFGGNDSFICDYDFDDQDAAATEVYEGIWKTALGDMTSCTPDDRIDPAYEERTCGMRNHMINVYMHEFGHLLGLRHGGGDGINCKPNYASIMNYMYTQPDIEPSRKLNYSEHALPTIYENSLNENVVFDFPWAAMHWATIEQNPDGSVFDKLRDATVSPPGAGTRVDWNGNKGAPEVGYPLKVSHYSAYHCEDTALTTLTGYDDWSSLRFDFRRHADDIFSQASQVPEPDVMSARVVASYLDTDGDGVSNLDDNCITDYNPQQEDDDRNGIGNACERVRQPTDLSISALTSPSGRVRLGSNVSYFFTLSNLSDSTENDTTLLQVLPDNMVFVSASTPQGTCRNDGASVACTLHGLPAHASMTVTVVAKAVGKGSATSTAEVYGFLRDTDASNNTTSVSVTVTASSPGP